MSAPVRPLDFVVLLDPEPQFDRCLNAIRPFVDLLRRPDLHWTQESRTWSAEYTSLGGCISLVASGTGIHLMDRPTAIASRRSLAIVPLPEGMADDAAKLAPHVLAVFDAIASARRVDLARSREDGLPWMLAAMALAVPRGASDGVELATPWTPTRLEKVSRDTPAIPPHALARFDAAIPMGIAAKADMVNSDWRLTVSPRFGWPKDGDEWHPDHDPVRTIRALAHVAAAGGLLPGNDA